MTVWNKLYDAELFRNIQFPEGRIHEDEFVTYRLVCEAKTVAVIYSKLYYYRRRQDSITGSFSPNRMDAHFAFCEREVFFREREEKDLLNVTENIHSKWISNMIPELKKHGFLELGEMLQEYQWILRKNLYHDYETCEQIDERIIYLFPFSKIPYGSRVVLYGAGKIGVQFFSQIVKSSYCQLEAWIDKDAGRLKEKGYPVKELLEWKVLGRQWDYVVIAVANEKTAFEIIEDLKTECMVSNDKIVRFMEEVVGYSVLG